MNFPLMGLDGDGGDGDGDRHDDHHHHHEDDNCKLQLQAPHPSETDGPVHEFESTSGRAKSGHCCRSTRSTCKCSRPSPWPAYPKASWLAGRPIRRTPDNLREQTTPTGALNLAHQTRHPPQSARHNYPEQQQSLLSASISAHQTTTTTTTTTTT